MLGYIPTDLRNDYDLLFSNREARISDSVLWAAYDHDNFLDEQTVRVAQELRSAALEELRQRKNADIVARMHAAEEARAELIRQGFDPDDDGISCGSFRTPTGTMTRRSDWIGNGQELTTEVYA